MACPARVPAPRLTGPAALLACALAGCYGNADVGRFAARLPVLTVGDAAAAPDAEAARLLGAARQGGEPLPVEAGGIWRLARVVSVPSEVVSRVPEGVRELRLWVTEPVTRAPVPADCRVELTATWDAGAPAQVVSAQVRHDDSDGWMSFRLTAPPRATPPQLRLRARPTAACGDAALVVAVSEVTPVVPSRLEKRPNLVLVAFTGLPAGELDCTEATSRKWPRVFKRWCVRGVSFAEAFATSTDPARAVASLLSGAGAAEAAGAGAPPLASLLQREGYATFAVTPAGLRGPEWLGFDGVVELAPGAPLVVARAAVGQALGYLVDRPLAPFFVALVLPALAGGAGPELDHELDRVVDYFVKSKLEARTAFIVTAASGALDATGALEARLRVPLVIVPPSRGGVPPALTRTSALASASDVYATALGLTGTPVPPSSSSRDLTWALEGSGDLGRPWVASQVCDGGPGCALAVTTQRARAISGAGGREVEPRGGSAGPVDELTRARRLLDELMAARQADLAGGR
jgi:hypothetical protein